MTKRVEPLIYRDVLSIITRRIDIQTWGRLKQSCKLFNKILVKPPIRLTFEMAMRRLLYFLNVKNALKTHYNTFVLELELQKLKYLLQFDWRNDGRYFKVLSFTISHPSGIIYHMKVPFGNIFNHSLDSMFDLDEKNGNQIVPKRK
jgi:hypothetical protein